MLTVDTATPFIGFTSGTQRRQGRFVHRDEFPFRNPGKQDPFANRWRHNVPSAEFDPRPEFVIADNPFLDAFRDDDAANDGEDIGLWLDWDIDTVNGSEAQRAHAVRVLSKVRAYRDALLEVL